MVFVIDPVVLLDNFHVMLFNSSSSRTAGL